MRTIHLIHGFNEDHPVQHPTIACLKDHIRQRDLAVRIHDYGHWDLVATRNNGNLARLIYPAVKPGDTLVGFSNGAAIVAHLQRLGTVCPKIVLIQPALKNTWVPNQYCDEVTVFWNPGDMATVGGKWYRRATSLFPWRWQAQHNWGEMGHTGYVGDDDRYLQFQTDTTPGMSKVSGHGQWDEAGHEDWRRLIASYT